MNVLLFPVRRFKKLLQAMLYAKREYLEKIIFAMEEKYGTIMNYLKEVVGITEEKVVKLKKLFLC